MTAPDLPLSQRMRQAADALQQFNTENDLYTPDAPWRPSELRREAMHREVEECEVVCPECQCRKSFDSQKARELWMVHHPHDDEVGCDV